MSYIAPKLFDWQTDAKYSFLGIQLPFLASCSRSLCCVNYSMPLEAGSTHELNPVVMDWTLATNAKPFGDQAFQTTQHSICSFDWQRHPRDTYCGGKTCSFLVDGNPQHPFEELPHIHIKPDAIYQIYLLHSPYNGSNKTLQWDILMMLGKTEVKTYLVAPDWEKLLSNIFNTRRAGRRFIRSLTYDGVFEKHCL